MAAPALPPRTPYPLPAKKGAVPPVVKKPGPPPLPNLPKKPTPPQKPSVPLADSLQRRLQK